VFAGALPYVAVGAAEARTAADRAKTVVNNILFRLRLKMKVYDLLIEVIVKRIIL